MGSGTLFTRGPTSPAHDFFELMFEGADVFSSYWQPYLKGVGRWHLELAQFGAKQTRAAMALGHNLARAAGPEDISTAYRNYWDDVHHTFEDASRNMAAAVVRAAPQNIVLDMPQQQRRVRRHDTLELIDGIDNDAGEVRKVA